MHDDEKRLDGEVVKVKISNEVHEGRLFQHVEQPYIEFPNGKKVPVGGAQLENLRKQIESEKTKAAAVTQPKEEAKPVQNNVSKGRNEARISMEEREAQKKYQSTMPAPGSEEKVAEVTRNKHKHAEKKHNDKLDKQSQKRIKAEEKAAKKVAKREAKAMSQITGDADGYNPEKTKKKKIIISVVYVLAIIGVLVASKLVLDFQQDEVAVIRLKSDKLAGESIDKSDIESFKMLRKTYDELGTVQYTNAQGQTSVKQIIYTWDEKDEVLDKYIANYTQGGQYLTMKNVTDKKVVRNPWLAEVKAGQEIYTLPIETEGVNTRLLLPGTHLRVRVVVQMDDASNPFKKGEEGTAPKAEEVAAVESESATNELNKGALLSSGSQVPTASVVFDDLVAIDMLNSSNESLFDIYMALYKLSVEERIEYLETTIEEGSAQEFQKRVMPTSLVLVLSKEQATQMAEFENLGDATIKYTILPYTDEDGNLLSNFTEIANQMNEIIENANY